VEQIPGGYAKTVQTADLGQGIQVIGEGPFTAKLDGGTVRISTDGRARVLHIRQAPPLRPSGCGPCQSATDGWERWCSAAWCTSGCS
jgi:hypothetical protein